MAKERKSRRRRWIKWGAIGAGVFVVFNIAAVEVTSQSWFCNSCHIMGPFYDSWKESVHGDIGCVKCHIEPGVDSFLHAKLNGLGQVVDDALNRTSTKPSASVSQMACLRSGCHSMEGITGTKIVGERFKFDHGKHVGKEYYGIEIHCTTCHSHVKGDTHFEVNTGVCITCHMLESSPSAIAEVAATAGVAATTGVDEHGAAVPVNGHDAPASPIRMAIREGHTATAYSDAEAGRPPAACRTCHRPPEDEIKYNGLVVAHEEYLRYGAACESCHRDATSRPAPIDDAACLSCHTFGIDKSLPTEEIHKAHAEGKHKIECFSCHGMPRHGPAAQTMKLEQFDCRSCHADQHVIQRRAYAHAVETPTGPGAGPVSPMFLAHVDCTGCHVKPSPLEYKPNNGAHVARAVPQACDACHEPGLGERMIPLWQNATRGLFDSARAELEAMAPAPEESEAAALLRQARELLDLVEMDGSWGVHNPRYTQKLLEQARDALAAAKGASAGEDEPREDPGETGDAGDSDR